MVTHAEKDTLYQQQLIAKRQAFHIAAGQKPTLEVIVRDTNGMAMDLTELAASPTVRTKIYEAVRGPHRSLTGSASVENAALGVVRVVFSRAAVLRPGIYDFDCGIFDGDVPVHNVGASLFVELSAWGDTNARTCMPTLQEMRQSVQQSDLLENLLRQEWVYTISDFCSATVRAVRFWNEQLPVICRATFNTTNFPFRNLWLDGIQLFMFQAAEEWYRRNRLSYNAEGVTVDDIDRSGEYKQAWQERLELFKNAVSEQKARINIDQGFAVLGGYTMGGY